MSGPEAIGEKNCPTCGKPAQEKWRPFCSKRCADVDLNRWLSGTYTIPVVEDEEAISAVPEPDADREP